MFRLFECCALSFFERFVLSFSLKIERFVSDSAEIWICGLYNKPEVSDVLISQIDWLASLASLVDARIPKGSAPDSYNRLANLLGQDKTDRPWVIEQASNHTLSVRTKDWKFIEGSDGPKMIPWGPKIETGYLGIPQLYDMKQAGEKVNLATEHPEKVFELQQILRKVRDKSIQMK